MSIVLLVLLWLALVVCAGPWVCMLILGAILGNHDLYTPSFWECVGGIVVASIVIQRPRFERS